jgi:hypothetical protein
MEPLKRVIELVKESNFKDANEICFDALYSKIEEKLTEKTETVRESCNCNNGNEELDPVNKKELKGKHKDRKDKDIDNDGDVDSSDKYLHKRRKAVSKAMSEDDEKDFKPHMMYDKDGKEYKAKTHQDHVRMSKMGYTHEKPEVKEEKMKGKKRGKHDCATHVNHEQFGEGQCIHSQHATPDENGNIAWYDVMFEHGIEKGVSINELKVVASEMHEDHHDVEEAKSVPLVRTGQGSFTKDTHPKRKDGKVERMYQAKDKAEYAKLIAGADTGRRGNAYSVQGSQKKMTVTVVFDNDKQRSAYEKKMKVEAYHEGAEMDIAKEKEKMAASQEKMRDLAIKLKKEKERKRAEA